MVNLSASCIQCAISANNSKNVIICIKNCIFALLGPPEDTSEFPTVPIHIVTSASQLPPEFLDPPADKLIVIGFDCEGIDLCREGALCVMQVI